MSFSTKSVRHWAEKFRSKLEAAKDREVTAILSAQAVPNVSRAEQAFNELQSKYGPRMEYGYDMVSLWRRATGRSMDLVSLNGMEVPGKSILDVGTGDGMLGVALEAFGHAVTLMDQEDWRHEHAKSLKFYMTDCCKRWPLEESSFDLVCSYNSFEHFPDPPAALAEMVRVLKPGGWIHLDFGPLYASPWGLHAYRALRMPYSQFLFSREFIAQKLEEIGIWDLGKKRTELQYLNAWKPGDFDRLWQDSKCRIMATKPGIDRSHFDLVTQFPDAFRGRGLKLEDIATSSAFVTLRK